MDLATEQAGLGKARKSEDFTLAAIELLIEKFRQSGRSRDLAKNLEAWTPLLRELIGKVAEPTRQAALQEFLTLVEPLKAVENPTPGQQISHYRMRGQPEKAAELLKDWTERPHELSHRVPTEVLLAVSRTEEALDQHLRYLFAADVDAALDQQWPYYKVRDLDLLADILEYRDDPRALTARQLCLANVDGVEMRYLTSLELCRHTRARGKLGLWVKYRALASLLSLNSLMFTVAALEKEAPLVKAILEGRAAIPNDLDEFLLPACDQLGAYTEFFPYLVGRLAHRLRLDGELVKADQLVARCYTLRCMDQSLYGL